jgi:hypothetical protein
MKGGNYEKDVTTRMTLGMPTKPLSKIVATKPGYPTMSGENLFQLESDLDRNGDDMYT